MFLSLLCYCCYLYTQTLKSVVCCVRCERLGPEIKLGYNCEWRRREGGRARSGRWPGWEEVTHSSCCPLIYFVGMWAVENDRKKVNNKKSYYVYGSLDSFYFSRQGVIRRQRLQSRWLFSSSCKWQTHCTLVRLVHFIRIWSHWFMDFTSDPRLLMILQRLGSKSLTGLSHCSCRSQVAFSPHTRGWVPLLVNEAPPPSPFTFPGDQLLLDSQLPRCAPLTREDEVRGQLVVRYVRLIVSTALRGVHITVPNCSKLWETLHPSFLLVQIPIALIYFECLSARRSTWVASPTASSARIHRKWLHLYHHRQISQPSLKF